MRLICPKCSAQYEVDASVIPATGRDVQCSNCGRTWFQKPEGAEIAATEATPDAAGLANEAAAGFATDTADDDEAGAEIGTEIDAGGDEPAAVGAVGAVGDDEAAQDGVPADTRGDAHDDGDFVADDALATSEDRAATADGGQDDAAAEAPARQTEPEPQPEPAVAPRRQTLDDAVLNVLREEAAREARVRAAEGTAIETQSDLGLTAAIASTPAASRDAEVAAAPARDRVARLRDDAEDADEADESLAGRGSRRELLPDIEEINSTLRATSDRGNEPAARDAPETLRRRRSGFRMGFSTSLIIAVFLLAIYVLAPMIAARAPALEPALARYVAVVDQARVWLDAKMKSTTEAMRGTPSQ